MSTKSRWISSLLLLITIVGLIFAWEQVKPDMPKYIGFFGYTPESVNGKRYNTMEEALEKFSNAYVDEYDAKDIHVHYKSTQKFEKQDQIPGVITFNTKEKNPRNHEFKIAPIYINKKNNQYYVTAYGIAGSSTRLKESPKYSHFSQPIKNHVFDFIVAKKKEYLPRTEVVLPLKEKNMYVGINVHPRYE